MVKKGERAPGGGVETEKSAERQEVEQQLGKSAIEAANARDQYYKRQRGKAGSKELVRDGEEGKKNWEKIATKLRERKDKHGNQKYSEATIERIREKWENGDKTFDPDVIEKEEKQKRAAEEFEKKRQAEMKDILAGRSPEVAAREISQDMKKLQTEIESMEKTIYFDPAMREYQKGQIEQAMLQYAAMGMRRDRVFEQMSEAQQEAVLFEQEESSPVSGETEEIMGEADANTAERLTSAAYDTVIMSLGEQDAELRALLERKKQELEAQGAGVDDETFAQIDESVQNTAETMAEEIQDESYWNNVAVMAAEADDRKAQGLRGNWESDEEYAARVERESSEERREGIVKKIYEKLKSRKGFKRAVAQTVIVLASVLMLAGVASRNNGGGEPVVYAAENSIGDEGAETQGVAQDNVAEAEEIAQVLGITPEDLMNSGDISYEGVDLASVGEQMYAGMAEREGTQVLPNGVMANLTEYETANEGKGTNHFGNSKDFLFDLEEARNATTAQELLSIVRDQPQTMAAVVSQYPQILEACGVDQGIIENQNVEQRAQGVLDAILNGENGGELQKKLLAATGIALYNENTSFEFYLENDTERTFYMAKADAEKGDAVENIMLRLDTKKRSNAKQVQIVLSFADGTHESGDYNLNCGFQPNLQVDQAVKREPVITVTVVEEVPDDEPEEEEKELVTIDEDEDEEDDQDEEDDNTEEEDNDDEEEDDDDDEEEEDEEDDDPTPPVPPVDPPVPPEEVKPKDEENEKKVVEDGGQTDPVDQTENIDNKTPGAIETPSNQTEENQVSQDDITGNTTGTYDQTEESTATPGEGAGQEVTEGQVTDSAVSNEQQVADQSNQETADNNYENVNLSDMTDDEFNEYVDSLLR